ncbi:hypothetical protein [Streptomyces sp. NPDC047841]|uniref:hypothetical protein n=1 Tax=Streptomyces sp. NPDC047841 TaxID=3154708 RepID=UPI00345457B1
MRLRDEGTGIRARAERRRQRAATSGAGHPLPYDAYRAVIERETRRFAGAVRDADPAGAVPSGPDRTPAGLARHGGTVQRWSPDARLGGGRGCPDADGFRLLPAGGDPGPARRP